MANFYTHTFTSGALGVCGATILAGAGVITANESLFLLAVCLFGGILPDIDSDSPFSLNILAKIFCGVCAFLIVFPFMTYFAILISLGLFVLSYLVIRFGALTLITQNTEHRGVTHSLPFIFLATFVCSIIMYDFFNLSAEFSWLGAGFLLIGLLSHLILDECSMENLASEPIERPRGRTFKLISPANWISYAVVYVALIISFFFTPSFKVFADKFFSQGTLQSIEHRLFSGSVPVELANITEDDDFERVAHNGLLEEDMVFADDDVIDI